MVMMMEMVTLVGDEGRERKTSKLGSEACFWRRVDWIKEREDR